MAEITERLGFDAAQAISTLKELDNAIKGVNRRLTTFNQRASATNGQAAADAMQNLTTQSNAARQSLGRTSQAMRDTGRTGQRAAQQITIGFGGLAKALVAREIVSALNNLKSAILESADAAEEFQISVARISNIARGPGSSIDDLTESLAGLAVELGRPQTEVLGAAFEALQNDLGNTEETINLLEGSVNDLALITGGTLTQSVNAISSVLKAYNLDVSEAADVSDTFFVAIDKGRVSLEDLESSLGKITPLAARLQIPFEQVAGAMAAITQSGTSAATANTQLRNVFQKLLKPTEGLQAAFEKLGVETFQQLISESGGLQQALNAISAALGNNDRAIAAAFGTIRGQLGVFNLLANEGQIFSDTMDAIADRAGAAAAAADRIDGTAARESQRAFAEFNETMRQVGERVLEARTSFVQLFNRVIPDGETAIIVMNGLAASIAALGSVAVLAPLGAAITAIRTLGVTAALAAAPLSALIGVGVAVGVGLGLVYSNFADLNGRALDQIEKRTEEASKRIQANLEKANEESRRQNERLFNSRTEQVEEYLAGLERAFDRETDIFRQSSKIVSDTLSTDIQDFENGMTSIFDSIENRANNLQSNLESALGDAANARQALSDFQFERDQRDRTPTQQFNAELERAEDTAKDLEKALDNAKTDPEEAAKANRLADSLERQAEAVRRRAESEDNAFRKREGLERADELQEQALEARVDLTENEVDALESQVEVTDTLLNRQKAITKELGVQLQRRKELLGLLNEESQIKSPEQRAAAEQELQQLDGRIANLGSQISQQLLTAFGEDRNAQALLDNLKSGFQRAEFDFANLRAAVQNKLNEGAFRAQVDIVANRGSTGDAAVDAQLSDAVSQAGANPVSRAEALREESNRILNEQTDAQNTFNAKIDEFNNLQEASRQALERAAETRGNSDITALTRVTDTFKRLQDQLSDPNLTAQQVETIRAQFNALAGETSQLFELGALSESTATNIQEGIKTGLSQAETALEAIQLKAEFSPETIEALRNNIQQIPNEPIEAFGQLSTDLQNAATSAQNVVVQQTEMVNKSGEVTTAVGGIKTSFATLPASIQPSINAMSRLEQAARRAAQAVAAARGGGGGFSYHGGVQYRAAGGPTTRGQDTQLTALAPGEFVTNARNTRNFFAQLQAINAGQQPAFREQGGPVTNVGDINVNVTGADLGNASQTGRQLASSLRRELRRGTSTL